MTLDQYIFVGNMKVFVGNSGVYRLHTRKNWSQSLSGDKFHWWATNMDWHLDLFLFKSLFPETNIYTYIRRTQITHWHIHKVIFVNCCWWILVLFSGKQNLLYYSPFWGSWPGNSFSSPTTSNSKCNTFHLLTNLPYGSYTYIFPHCSNFVFHVWDVL